MKDKMSKMGKSHTTKATSGGMKDVSARREGKGGKQHNSGFPRQVAKTEGGSTISGRSGPKRN